MTGVIGRLGGIGQSWPSTQAADPPVRAFLDLSNIWGGVREAAAAHGESGLPVRLSAVNLASVLRAGRADFRLTTVANADVRSGVIRRFEGVGGVIRRESGRLTHTEQANDETLQVRMYESIHTEPQAVLVLATGDGAGWSQARGFVPSSTWLVDTAGPWRLSPGGLRLTGSCASGPQRSRPRLSIWTTTSTR